MKNLILRIISALILASVAVLGILYLPKSVFFLCVSLIVFLATFELGSLLKEKYKLFSPLELSIVAFISSLNFLFFNLFFSLLIIFLYAFFKAIKTWSLEYLSLLIFSLIYTTFFISTIGILFNIDKNLLFILFATVWAGDTMAYVFGKAIGKRRLSPRISPKKTIEGAVGSIIGSLLFAVPTAYYFKHQEAIFAIVLASVIMQIGDLFESFIKRQVGKKDSSNIIPGHGGILDRIDALMFASVIFVAYYNLISI